MGAGAFSLQGQRVLVTGAAGGIGAATARLAAEQGAVVLAADLADPAAIAERSGVAMADCHRLDTGDRAAVEAYLAGAGRIDGLVDAAAICPADDWMAPDWDAALQRVLAVNVGGPINLSRALLPAMAAQGAGRMVFCGSIAGWMGGIVSGPHYAFSKGGLHAFVRWLARRAAPQGVLVNAIAPGPVETAMTEGRGYRPESYPLGRMARPEEIAATAVFLLGPGAGYAAGAVFDINGATHFR
jgi:NAD(P)-dependent dehydrogenase (short-subunit alcohol dehydrogenase family)